MNDKNARRLPLIAFAALPLTLGLVFAQTTPQRVQPAQPAQNGSAARTTQQGKAQGSGQNTAPRPQSGTNYAEVFLQKLAAQLGVSTDKLRAAAVTAGGSTIDQGVKAGDFPSDMAQNMKQNLAQDPFMLAGGRGHGGRGHHMDGDGPRGDFGQGGPGLGTVTAAVARALGLDEQGLLQQLQGGQTIAGLAQAKGVSTVTIHNAAVAALKNDLATAVKDQRLTQAQATQMLQQAQADSGFGLQLGGRGGHRGAHPGAHPGGNDTQGSGDTNGVAPATSGNGI